MGFPALVSLLDRLRNLRLDPSQDAQSALKYTQVPGAVKAGPDACTINVCKEFPGAVMARMKVKLPAVLGILGAEQAPRYVPVSRIRAAMKSTQFEEQAVATTLPQPSLSVCRLYPPASGSHAEMLSGSEADVAARIAQILAEKGLVK